MGQALDRLVPVSSTSCLGLHTRPIKQIVSLQSYSFPEGKDGRPNLGERFVLRCLQRLSAPDMATQRCPWRNNWYTIGLSLPVLSY